MARSLIGDHSTSLQNDSGGVLWSFVQGEQLEFPVTLNFLTNAGAGYTYEAVVMEGENVLNSGAIPTVARSGGVNTSIEVYVPPEQGTWSAPVAYNRDDVVLYNGLYYKLASGTARVSATTPDVDPLWEVYVPNKIYLRFLSTLSKTPAWTVQPTTTSNIYGFFELRVTEPAGGLFQRTWKPMRGLVELLYSPTDLV